MTANEPRPPGPVLAPASPPATAKTAQAQGSQANVAATPDDKDESAPLRTDAARHDTDTSAAPPRNMAAASVPMPEAAAATAGREERPLDELPPEIRTTAEDLPWDLFDTPPPDPPKAPRVADLSTRSERTSSAADEGDGPSRRAPVTADEATEEAYVEAHVEAHVEATGEAGDAAPENTNAASQDPIAMVQALFPGRLIALDPYPTDRSSDADDASLPEPLDEDDAPDGT